MATLLLTAVGTLVGGPLGGAVGALVGRQVDGAIFGAGGSRQGPRLKELTVSTSSYGQPIARHFGQMRVPGTIIWATDLKETKETSGGGKGKPKTTTYSYSVSLAVALSSTPIESIGRIWADGNLLRGSAGDLKAPGTLRIHLGYGDQAPDPLIAAAQGGQVPGFRNCAYVVFEDLALGDFGNRIPALSFEVFAQDKAPVRLSQLVPEAHTDIASDQLDLLHGFSDEGGNLSSILDVIDSVYPLSCSVDASGLNLARLGTMPVSPPTLPTELRRDGHGSKSRPFGRQRSRSTRVAAEPRALRYYDSARDYQAGIQHAPGQRASGGIRMVELPATMTANNARTLSLSNAQNQRWRSDTISWRIAELDPDLQPGKIVRLPDHPGEWVISSWELFDRGIELGLERLSPGLTANLVGDQGYPGLPLDLVAPPTIIRGMELPPGDASAGSTGLYFAALGSADEGWQGAALYVERDQTLVATGQSTREIATIAQTTASLGSSNCTHIERNAVLELDLSSSDAAFSSSTIEAINSGSNRLLVGGEVIQFVSAEQTGPSTWQLGGLLRGRGGTEHVAAAGHPAGTDVIALDRGLIAFDPSLIAASGTTRIAAIGIGDQQPVFADLVASGLSRNPISPVHPRHQILASGDLECCWTRRARGHWQWLDSVEVPLVEESELYQVGAGPIDDPHSIWQVSETRLTLASTTLADISNSHGPFVLWVRQLGTFGTSPATFITSIS